ncbi:PHB depolymerase family esterase [soil metagenome]
MVRTIAALVVVTACNTHSGVEGVDAVLATDSVSVVDSSVVAVTCSGKAMQPTDAIWTIQSGGVSRLVNVHVPASYDPTHPMPLVLNFHGFTSDGVQEDLLSQMTPKSDAAGFVVMYPIGTGIPLSWNAGACCGTAAASSVDDIQFVRDLLATANQTLCTDATRIYATGMSNGGFLSHRIGCELADTFAAIAPVAGVLGVPSCAPTRPMPVMHFHGTADPLVPYDGSTILGFPSVSDTFRGWAARDTCTGEPIVTFAHGDASCSTYQHCAAGAEVTLCTITGGGHTWPGGTPVPTLGATSTDLSATDAMWTFFTAHHL